MRFLILSANPTTDWKKPKCNDKEKMRQKRERRGKSYKKALTRKKVEDHEICERIIVQPGHRRGHQSRLLFHRNVGGEIWKYKELLTMYRDWKLSLCKICLKDFTGKKISFKKWHLCKPRWVGSRSSIRWPPPKEGEMGERVSERKKLASLSFIQYWFRTQRRFVTHILRSCCF